MRSGLEGDATAADSAYSGSSVPPTKKQERPRVIKFLQERLDRSWDVHAIGQAFALVCATPECSAGV
jgi:hypothetical protein